MRWLLALIFPFLLAGCSSTPSSYGSHSECGSVVVVRSGDTLGEIAQRCHVSLRTLARFNGIDPPYMIRIGQRLRIPDARAIAAQQQGIAPQRSVPKRASQRPLVWPLAGATVEWKPDPKGGAGMLLRSRKPLPVRAMTTGKVVTLTRLPTYGPVVVIDHGRGLYGVYARLQQIEVTPGQSVAAGQAIGRCAPEGRDASVCYVELREARRLLDLRRWKNWTER
ncbi:lipoprotein NlpD/lipoprotein YgeR [Sulfurivirga caldicuralii]|uniref:Lipoprotein NlpD/lipoprotein YgeR n=1 Tax=Sulfurivirga caldicuralii TaxID=364032 RepID=A0A1N6F9E5_9GAMM|nr:peptidoglycan DD-metalloendopeptidase family protein [Sulfurivirga caldicuralii]SIN91836.1 lipoprotein NlpD/lipoprotein YgeR [Sulfurivirga caldicuralii]